MGRDMMEFTDALAVARAGVDYSPRFGAVCPACGTKRAKVTSSCGWEEGYKIRYHKCRNNNCTMAVANISIKSIEKDYVTGKNG